MKIRFYFTIIFTLLMSFSVDGQNSVTQLGKNSMSSSFIENEKLYGISSVNPVANLKNAIQNNKVSAINEISTTETLDGNEFIVKSRTSGSSVDFDPINKFHEVQLGLGGLSYYSKPFYANAMYMESRAWRSTDETNYPIQTGQFDPDNNPLYLTLGQILYVQPGQNAAENKAAYGGRICVTWEGEADIRGPGTYLSSPSPATGSIVNGKRYYYNGTTPNGINTKIYAINPDNPPRNIKIWLNDLREPSKSLDPDEQGGKVYLINPAYSNLFAVDAFTLYRFMDLANTNGSPISNWSDRRKPSNSFRVGKYNGIDIGIPYEDMVAICNEFNKDMWLNVPAQANQDFVEKLAMLINGQDPDGIGSPGLKAGLRCYVEYGNEMGWTYWADYCSQKGALEGISGRNYAGRQAARVHSWFRNIVGAENPRFKFIHCIQSSAFATSDGELNESCVVTGPTLSPSGVPDYIGITSYFGSSIERYVFDEINYWDPAVKDKELEKVFLEFEKRSLNRAATVTGVDFTGGISEAGQLLSQKYGLPLIAYEGGCGLNPGQGNCMIDCKLVPKGTPNSITAYQMKDLAEKCGGGNNYLNFLRAIHTDSRMRKMFEINMCLAKASGLQTLTQFGDVAPISGNIDYGYWACVNDLNQNPLDAYRYQFWLEWYQEQKDIREVGDSMGTRPKFYTSGELYPAKAGSAYSQEIKYGGGDGLISIKMINRTSVLPASLSFDYQSDKVVITGTPANNEAGTYFIMYRLLDQDKDPAYAVFTLRILPAPMDSIFAFDDFGSIEGPLQGSNTGYGFSSTWTVQNSNSANFSLLKTASLSFPGLSSSGNVYARGGGAYLTSGRVLDVPKFDYLRQSVNPNVIGQTNTSLWFSVLVNRSTNTNGKDIFRFTNSQYYQDRTTAEQILLVDESGKWALDIKNTTGGFDRLVSDIDVGIGKTFLVVMEFKFDLDNDIINLYINPGNLGGLEPDILPVITYTTSRDMTLSRLGFYGGISAAVNIDDLRFGDTYKAVTPKVLIPDILSSNSSSSKRIVLPDEISFSPNPAEKQIHISTSEGVLEEIRIINSFGQEIIRKKLSSNFEAVDVSSLVSGVYVVMLKKGGVYSVHKLNKI